MFLPSNKGQAFSIDIMISATIFLVVLAIIITVWENQNSSAEEQLILQDMENAGTRAINFITRSPGETTSTQSQTPANITDWENEPSIATVKFIGLAKRDRAIDTAKIKKFASYIISDYPLLKSKLLLSYDFYFKFYYLDNSGNKVIIEEPLGTKMEGGQTLDTAKQYTNIIFQRIVNYEGSAYSGDAAIELQIAREKK